jgi:hypothetical protein
MVGSSWWQVLAVCHEDVESMLESLDIRAAAIIVAVLVVAAAETGFFLGRGQKQNDHDDAAFGVVQGAAYALVGLLLGFSFSLAVARFDARRATQVREANAIVATILRTDLLDAPSATQMRALLRRYIARRLEFSAAGVDVQGRARAQVGSERLQNQMWATAARAAKSDPRSTTVPLLIQSLNATIDASSEQDEVLAATIPASVVLVLVFLVLIAVGLMGFGFGRSRSRRPVMSAVLALMFALVIMTILDLDRPQSGFIQVSLKPLTDAQQLLDSRK